MYFLSAGRAEERLRRRGKRQQRSDHEAYCQAADVAGFVDVRNDKAEPPVDHDRQADAGGQVTSHDRGEATPRANARRRQHAGEPENGSAGPDALTRFGDQAGDRSSRPGGRLHQRVGPEQPLQAPAGSRQSGAGSKSSIGRPATVPPPTRSPPPFGSSAIGSSPQTLPPRWAFFGISVEAERLPATIDFYGGSGPGCVALGHGLPSGRGTRKVLKSRAGSLASRLTRSVFRSRLSLVQVWPRGFAVAHDTA